MRTITVKDLQDRLIPIEPTVDINLYFNCNGILCMSCIFKLNCCGCGGQDHHFDWDAIKQAPFKRRVNLSIKDVIKFSKEYKLKQYKTN